ncbi:MAG: DUF2147 domain-containing protein [Flavobacteriaceae bacterium]|nr:MAG: DUF2147 domain-containing protein [Flavobacteriaceae bacterium]
MIQLLKIKMKVLTTLFLLMFSIVYTSAQQSLEGLWKTGKEETIIEISFSSEQLIGKIKSSNNEEAEMGKIILKDLRSEGNKWVGKIYAVKRKEWYNVEIISKEEVLELKISSGLMSKSLQWKKSK